MHAFELLLEGEASGLSLTPCVGAGARLVGAWRWRGRIPRGHALWLVPCAAVHTFALPRAIEVAFCDRDGHILRLVAPLAPNRVAWCRGAVTAAEFRVGTSLRLGLRAGQRLSPARARQRGVAMVEYMLVMALGLVPLVLGTLQVCALLVAHDVVSLAAFQAVRHGAMAGADPSAMQSVFARGLLPLYVPAARGGQVPVADSATGHARALAEVRALDELAVLEPTRTQVRGLAITRGGRQVLPDEAIETRSAAARAAHVLTVSAMHCQPLVVPLVGPALAEAVALVGGAVGGAEGRCLAAGRVPLRARASVVLQADVPLANLPAGGPAR